jgi:hypothetical protein
VIDMRDNAEVADVVQTHVLSTGFRVRDEGTAMKDNRWGGLQGEPRRSIRQGSRPR